MSVLYDKIENYKQTKKSKKYPFDGRGRDR
jgi:hypothetical protein